MKLIILVYLLCGIGTYILLGKCLLAIDKKTNEPLNNAYGKFIVSFSRLIFSIFWIISLPCLYYIGKKNNN